MCPAPLTARYTSSSGEYATAGQRIGATPAGGAVALEPPSVSCARAGEVTNAIATSATDASPPVRCAPMRPSYRVRALLSSRDDPTGRRHDPRHRDVHAR